jgi:hypothetical protein
MDKSKLQQVNLESITNEQISQTAAEESTKGPDPFDIDKLVLTQSFAEAVGAEEVINKIAVRKPNKQEWFRVHPDPAFRKNLGVIEIKGDNETYFVALDLIAPLSQWCVPATVYTYIDSTVNSLPRLWAIRLPKEGEADMDWWSSGRSIAEYAMGTWTQMWADKAGGMYRFRATQKLADKQPDWRGLTSARLFEIAVKPRYISSLDHPVAKKLLTGV